MKILITGTNSGIGKYLKENLEKSFKVYKISKSDSGEQNFVKCDLTKSEEIRNIDFGKIQFDSIILNAGVGYFGDFFEGKIEDYEEMINLNILGNIRLLKHLEKNIRKNTKIIFIGSVVSKKFFANGSVYTASKFAIRGLAGALRKDFLKTYLVNPKIVDTNFHNGKIDLQANFEKTSKSQIFEVVKLILEGKENRFEIDL